MDEMVKLRDVISDRMEAGESLEEMEQEIEDSGLSEDEQSAVWLFAWSYLSGGAQRQKAVAAAGALAETYDGPSGPQANSAQQLSDVMEAVREHEDQTQASWRRRYEDEQLYRRVRRALASREDLPRVP
jgi:hypothetical protein